MKKMLTLYTPIPNRDELIKWAFNIPHVCVLCGREGSLFSGPTIGPADLVIYDCNYETSKPACRHVICHTHTAAVRAGVINLHAGEISPEKGQEVRCLHG